MVDLLWLVVGLFIGAAATAAALELAGRNRRGPASFGHVTTHWRLGDLSRPTIVVRDLLDIDAPPGSKVYASGLVDPLVQGTATVRQVGDVDAEFALDHGGERALVFLAGARRGSAALLTVEPELVARLAADARRVHHRSRPYVERHRIQDLAGRDGVAIETEGTVRDLLPFQGRTMVRLEDDGHIIGVLVDAAEAELVGQRVTVEGRLGRDRGGYPVVEADRLGTL